jgi:hypothetical protein
MEGPIYLESNANNNLIKDNSHDEWISLLISFLFFKERK